MNEPSIVESSVPEKKKKVSFSQYAMWMKCPYQWKLNYIDKLKKKDANLSIFFGTAMHYALQTFIETLYTKGAIEAHEIDVKKLFVDKFNEELSKEKEKPTTGPDSVFTYTDDEYKEFLYDGDDIIDFFLSNGNRIKYFPTKKYEFVGVEIPLDMEILHNVDFIAFIDLVLRDKVTGKYKIFDLKTSAVGWNNYMKEDESKFSQVLLYKAFYSKKFNVALSDIDVEFFILKRKLYENVSFPQSRIQTFTPTHNHTSISEALNGFINFVQECFTQDGSYNLEKGYIKIPGKAKKNCKYCKHYKSTCDGKADKIETEII